VRRLICLALLLLLLDSEAFAKTTPEQWSAIASKLAGKPTRVSCGPMRRSEMALGITHLGRNPRIVLDYSVCASLRMAPRLSPWIPAESRFPDMASFVAIQTLAHEAMHARGIRNEDAAECVGFLNFGKVALALGFSRSDMRALVYMEQMDPSLNCSAVPSFADE
jgi:hypothetical protein